MEEVGRFDVISPTGARRTIVQWQHYTDFKPLTDTARKLLGATEFLTSDGVDASQNSDGSFTTFDSDETFARLRL